MNSFCDKKLERLRAEAQIERLLRSRNQNFPTFPELERLTKRILKLRFWGVQLEIKRWAAQ